MRSIWAVVREWFLFPAVREAATEFGVISHRNVNNAQLAFDEWSRHPGAFSAFDYGDWLAAKLRSSRRRPDFARQPLPALARRGDALSVRRPAFVRRCLGAARTGEPSQARGANSAILRRGLRGIQGLPATGTPLALHSWR